MRRGVGRAEAPHLLAARVRRRSQYGGSTLGSGSCGMPRWRRWRRIAQGRTRRLPRSCAVVARAAALTAADVRVRGLLRIPAAVGRSSTAAHRASELVRHAVALVAVRGIRAARRRRVDCVARAAARGYRRTGLSGSGAVAAHIAIALALVVWPGVVGGCCSGLRRRVAAGQVGDAPCVLGHVVRQRRGLHDASDQHTCSAKQSASYSRLSGSRRLPPPALHRAPSPPGSAPSYAPRNSARSRCSACGSR